MGKDGELTLLKALRAASGRGLMDLKGYVRHIEEKGLELSTETFTQYFKKKDLGRLIQIKPDSLFEGNEYNHFKAGYIALRKHSIPDVPFDWAAEITVKEEYLKYLRQMYGTD